MVLHPSPEDLAVKVNNEDKNQIQKFKVNGYEKEGKKKLLKRSRTLYYPKTFLKLPDMFKCNDPKGILCAKFVEVHKLMLHLKYRSSRSLGFKHKDF